MEDLGNKQLLKIMWLPEAASMIWDMKHESEISLGAIQDETANVYAEISSWAGRYEQFYKRWLEDETDVIYDIDHEINREILSIVKGLNATSNKYIFFYWFDVDRTNDDKFRWVTSPRSREVLFDLGPDFHFLNRLISVEDYMVFPKYE